MSERCQMCKPYTPSHLYPNGRQQNRASQHCSVCGKSFCGLHVWAHIRACNAALARARVEQEER